MSRGRCSCANSPLAYSERPSRRATRSSSTPFSRHHSKFRSYSPSLIFLHFPARTDFHTGSSSRYLPCFHSLSYAYRFRTEPSSLYPLSPLSLPGPYRKTRGGGRAAGQTSCSGRSKVRSIEEEKIEEMGISGTNGTGMLAGLKTGHYMKRRSKSGRFPGGISF